MPGAGLPAETSCSVVSADVLRECFCVPRFALCLCMLLRYVCACMVDYMHVHESMQLMIHGVELLAIGSTGHYEAKNKGNNVALGSLLFLMSERH
jgi:hypothetical protein